jgi:hypothetical protein
MRSVNDQVVCLGCRQVFFAGPETCPSCSREIFVYLSGSEDPNSLCDELFITANVARGRATRAQRMGIPVAATA